MDKTRQVELLENTEAVIETPQFLKSEVNLLLYPFFALSRKEVRTRTKTEYKTAVDRGGGKIELLWQVSSNSEYGYPGPFDKAVHKAIEEIISEIEPPIRNPIRFSIYDICKRIGIPTGGAQYRKVKEALERIKFTGIKSKGTFYSKARQEWIDDVFSLYERVIFQGAKLLDGRIAETNYLFLNSWYIENLNLFYIRPIDYKYYKSLNSVIAQRLYELLGVKFYYIIKAGLPFLHYRYSTLCQILPLTQHRYASYVKRQLDPAHKELIKTSFLRNVECIEILDEGSRKRDWLIRYFPGERAIEEVNRFRKRLERPLELELKPQLEQGEAIEEIPVPDDGEELELKGLVEEMIEVLGDEHSRPFYTKVARACPSNVIYRCLSEVKDDWLQGKVKKSKGALFTDKIKRYCQERGIDLGLKSGR